MATAFQPFDPPVQMMEFDSPFPSTNLDWSHDDATMEDDQSHYTQDFSEGVEVDMDYDQQQENPEYEMVDGEGVSTPFVESTELVDVELYDASPRSPNTSMQAQQTALHLDTHTSPEIQHGAFTDAPSVGAVELPASHPVLGEVHSQPHAEPAAEGLGLEPPGASHLEVEKEQNHHPLVYEANVIHESHATGDHTEEVAETQTTNYESTHLVGEVDNTGFDNSTAGQTDGDSSGEPLAESVYSTVDEFRSYVVADEQPHAPVAADNTTSWADTTLPDELAPSTEDPGIFPDGGVSLRHDQDSYHYDGQASVSAPGNADQLESVVLEEHEDGVADQDGEQSESASSKNPHEISDGVFIEPPPGVLVSLLSDPSPKFSLFNRPSSYPAGPSSSTLDDDAQSLTVLFEDSPTLYYEPFCKLFTALRECPAVIESPHFHEGELVMNFYDLQLSISEDNKYADDSIGLHEINILHGGLGLPGPLRCRIELPHLSFIQRYQSLLAEITYPEQHEEEHYDNEVHEENEGHDELHGEYQQPFGEEGEVQEHIEGGDVAAEGVIGLDGVADHSSSADAETSRHTYTQDRQTELLQAQALADAEADNDDESQQVYHEATAAAVPDEYEDSQEGTHDPYAYGVEQNEDVSDPDNARTELGEEASEAHDGLQHNEPNVEHQETDLPNEYEDAAHDQDDQDDEEDGADAENEENTDGLEDFQGDQHELADTAGIYTLPEQSAEVTDETEPQLEDEEELDALADDLLAQGPGLTVASHAHTEIAGTDELDAEFDLEDFADYSAETHTAATVKPEGDEEWHVPDDADSMVSSVTLSSTKSSSKRSLDDVFAEDGIDHQESAILGSPDSKRPRVV